MVWGMALPGEFGAFFPKGDYIGRWEELVAYFENEMPKEWKAQFHRATAYPGYVSDKFTRSPDWEGNKEIPAFSPIEPLEVPKRFTLERDYGSLGSLIKTTNCILAVDEALKDIFERFEPGVHQFFPLEVARFNHELYPRKFYTLVIGQYIDSFSPEDSDPESWRFSDPESQSFSYPDRTFFFRKYAESMAGLALSKQAFGSAHLWRERRMLTELICFSDALMTEIHKAGLKVPKHYRLKEI